MKSFLFLVPSAALLLTPAAAVGTDLGGPSMSSNGYGTVVGGVQARGLDSIPRGGITNRRMLKKVRALAALRQEGLQLRAADGGTLTPDHYAYLQVKLDAIQSQSN
ncbi:MAG: hypothetical protein KGJ49_13395 [Alphaproteobacteria bacterium]|nr:hypothetical protein [Alphaproteobacteria bacterium]